MYELACKGLHHQILSPSSIVGNSGVTKQFPSANMVIPHHVTLVSQVVR